MANQTSFNLDNARDLLKQLEKTHEVMRSDWSRVQNQWENLRSCWHDKQFQIFEDLYEKLTSAYSESQKEYEAYIFFLREEIRIAEERGAKLGALRGL